MKLNYRTALLTLALTLPGAALAALPPQVLTFNHSITTLPHAFSETRSFAAGTTFEHTWNFTFNHPQHINLFGLVADLEVASGSTHFLNLSNFMVNVNGGGWMSYLDDRVTFSAPVTSGGTYSVGVMGSASGMFGGAYSLSLSAAPIPEPEVWAMLLAGTTLIGLRVRKLRKSRSQTLLH